MSLRIIVLAKQVPDTRNVGKDAMKEDGTVNRAALPAIFNPEDLNALEQALRLLNYTDIYGQLDGQQHSELYKRGLAAVNQIYGDLWYTGRSAPFFPLSTLREPLSLTTRELHDVMPYGVAMLLALSEGDGDNQLLYAGLYNRKRAACGAATRRRNVLFRHMEEDA